MITGGESPPINLKRYTALTASTVYLFKLITKYKERQTMKMKNISKSFIFKDGEISIHSIIKLIAGVALISFSYTSGYIIGDFREEQSQLKSAYISKICIMHDIIIIYKDYKWCTSEIRSILNKPSHWPAQ